jgi:hypothetical protein
MWKVIVALSCAVLMAACGGSSSESADDAPGEDIDPRCERLCTIREPEIAGAFDVCSEASAADCRDECQARIADVEGVCATCLTADACFDTECAGGGDDPFIVCYSETDTCVVSGPGGECSYPDGNRTAREDCIRRAFPRREVACSAEYPPFSSCAGVCAP